MFKMQIAKLCSFFLVAVVVSQVSGYAVSELGGGGKDKNEIIEKTFKFIKNDKSEITENFIKKNEEIKIDVKETKTKMILDYMNDKIIFKIEKADMINKCFCTEFKQNIKNKITLDIINEKMSENKIKYKYPQEIFKIKKYKEILIKDIKTGPMTKELCNNKMMIWVDLEEETTALAVRDHQRSVRGVGWGEVILIVIVVIILL